MTVSNPVIEELRLRALQRLGGIMVPKLYGYPITMSPDPQQQAAEVSSLS